MRIGLSEVVEMTARRRGYVATPVLMAMAQAAARDERSLIEALCEAFSEYERFYQVKDMTGRKVWYETWYDKHGDA